MIGRREFITLFGAAAAAWPVAARAQQPEQVRRIGVLMNRAMNDREGQARIALFQRALQELGWSAGSNVRVDIRWGEDDAERERRYATELVELSPDVILAAGTIGVAALQRVTRSLPIVFVGVGDPVGAGFVETLSRPGGNTTGFMVYEFTLAGKWLEFLRQVAPQVTRVAVLRDPANASNMASFSSVQASAQPLGVEVRLIGTRDAGEIERGIADFARSANGGLLALPSGRVSLHRDLIISLAARHKLPTIYPFRYMVSAGGLISYGPDFVDQYRPTAGYVDRILKGEKPANLPVQAPTKYELAINLMTAKALGLTVPLALQVSADEVIE
jgi:putative tryptophan/tyrosine transport system substrate-binding protein